MKSIIFLVMAGLFITACQKVSYKKTASGLTYKVYRGKGVAPIKTGNILKLSYSQSIKDSVYFKTDGEIPLYLPVMDVAKDAYDISELWPLLHKGDSVIATQMMDTFIRRNPGNMRPEFKNGDRIVTKFRILEVFTSDSLARLDEEKERNAYLQGEIAFLKKHLDDKKITANKTPSGSFVQVITPGDGPLIDSGKYVSVDYTGTGFFSGKTFDSNTDTAFQHVQPLSFVVGTGQMIKGFDEAMAFLRKGAEARLYIPSILGYGARPQSPLIQRFEHLIFDIKVLDVQNAAPPAPASPGGRPVIQ